MSFETGEFDNTQSIDVSDLDDFVPELWSDEIIATYKANYVMPSLVMVMDFTGRKGDTVRIPKPARGSASAKVANRSVTLITGSSDQFNFTIDQHWEYSRLIEDIVYVQGLDSIRPFYTDDAGYALATVIDDHLHDRGALFGNGSSVAGSSYSKAVVGSDGTTLWDPTASGNAGNASALSDAGIRRVVQSHDDSDVPSRNRVLVVPPVEKRKLLGLARFTEQAFTGETGDGNSIRTGRVGNIYGIPVYVSSNCAAVADGGAATDQRACLLFQKEAVLLAMQMNPRTQSTYMQEYLADLMTADVLFGSGVPRPEAGTAIIVPST